MTEILNLISEPGIADGNPAEAIALHQSAQEADIDVAPIINLSTTSSIVQKFHHRTTQNPDKAQGYTKNSEAKRVNTSARLYASASFAEFFMRARRRVDGRPVRWNVVQEHALLGSNRRTLDILGVQEISLYTPDVFPKESGVLAASQSDAEIVVWNSEAFEYVADQGVRARMAKPILLDTLGPKVDTEHRGHEVVLKSSGSGIPFYIGNAILGGLYRSEQRWIAHTPDVIYESGVTYASSRNKQDRIRDFYDSLGASVKVLIGYPSELVGVGMELRARGTPVWMITLPPRGKHELNNLSFGHRHGLILGEIAIDESAPTSLPGLRAINPILLPEIIAKLEKPDTLPKGLISTSPVWPSP